MYDHGNGVAEDDHAAAIWYKKAAAQGEKNAPFNLGELYKSGRGVKQSYVQALVCLSLADADDDSIKEVSAKMSNAELAEARQLMLQSFLVTPARR